MENTIPQIGKMVLRSEVLKTIDTPQHRVGIAAVMGLTENAIRQYIIRNDVKLTQYAPLQYIKQVMGCLDASEVLEPKKDFE